MARTAQQIITLACQMARVPGFTSQAGDLLNVILSDLCQTYDLELARGQATITLSSTATPTASNPNIQGASGPYNLAADYLRAKPRDVFWFNQGVPMYLKPIDLQELDAAIQQAGFQSYPHLFATDVSVSPPQAYVWPPSSGAYTLFYRYFRQMPDIATPESSTTVPWFPNQQYLITRLAGELMRLSDDSRSADFLGDEPEHPEGAQAILRRYLQLKDDSTDRSKTVQQDARRFGRRFSTLPNTKTVGF